MVGMEAAAMAAAVVVERAVVAAERAAVDLAVKAVRVEVALRAVV